MEQGTLSDRVCAVVGASAGIGRAIAARLATEGARVVMLARHEARLAKAAADIGRAAMPLAVDVSQPDSVRSAFGVIEARFDRLDVLVNVAGVARLTLVEEATDEDIDYVMRINLFGPIYTARAATPLMRRTGGGTIVNISSEVTTDAMPYNTLYGASKGGLNALTSMLNRELRDADIRVCLCVVGRTSGTAFSDNFTEEQWAIARQRAEQEGYYARVAGSVAMTPEQVAEALVFMVTRPPSQILDVVHIRAAR